MSEQIPSKPHRGGFRHFFFRGLAIVLPTALTIWLLVVAYQFVAETIATPINAGIRWVVLRSSPWPIASNEDFDTIFEQLPATQKEQWATQSEYLVGTPSERLERRRLWMQQEPPLVEAARRVAIERWWDGVTVGTWRILDLIGLMVAIVLIYFVGVLLTSYVGRRLYARGEEMVNRIPLLRRVYPSIKQVTDFFFPGEDKALQFSRVVAVEYPRKGLWSVGLVTGTTMRRIEDRAGVSCLTVFVPSSPTPFTGYVITVPKADTIDLPITIEDAMKFAISGGVVVPLNQRIAGDPADLPRPRTQTDACTNA
ncbi:MAG: DUF502 domain-containing protein [Phycisphaeraceae bacterium]|nr:DUF502 domain-containing protein [Phycisphaeraceae bacterium]